jgi:hypothetical protein
MDLERQRWAPCPESVSCSPDRTGRQIARMRLYALVAAGDPEAIDVYLCEEDAQRALEDCLSDQPRWHGQLRVEEIKFAGILQSVN